jgi:hypothetical protein
VLLRCKNWRRGHTLQQDGTTAHGRALAVVIVGIVISTLVFHMVEELLMLAPPRVLLSSSHYRIKGSWQWRILRLLDAEAVFRNIDTAL